MYSIGEFSRISGLSVKTLRFYHEKRLLVPARVEVGSGYRHYDRRNLETAQIIVALRQLDFSLEQIALILAGHDDDADILEFLERQKSTLQSELLRQREIVSTLTTIIHQEQEARNIMQNSGHQIEQKIVEPVLVGGIRMKGNYRDCGSGFAKLGRKLGRHISGKAMMLCYDEEYRENDADFEVCMPIRRRVNADGIDVHELLGGSCVSLMHRGPHEELNRSYARLLDHVKEAGLKVQSPSREVYLKGPGMIFKGNPKKYLTEIQFLIES